MLKEETLCHGDGEQHEELHGQELQWQVCICIELAPDQDKGLERGVVIRAEDPREGATHFQGSRLPSNALFGEGSAVRWLTLLAQHVWIQNAFSAIECNGSVSSIMIFADAPVIKPNEFQADTRQKPPRPLKGECLKIPWVAIFLGFEESPIVMSAPKQKKPLSG